MGHKLNERAERGLRMASNHVDHRRTAAFELNDADIDPGQ
jgi:hypothetical protein